MKYSVQKVLRIDLTMDSSELIIFEKGGRHEVLIKKEYDPEEGDDDGWLGNELKGHWDEVKITVQSEDRGRFNFIKESAEKNEHFKRMQNEIK
jgi:hypothetical protein